MFKLQALSSTPEIIPIAGIHGLLTKPPSVLVAASGPASACKPKKIQQRRWRAGEGEGHRQRRWSLVHAEGRRKAASDELRPPVLATARHLLLLLCCWTIEEEEGDERTTAGDDDQVRREELVNRKLKQDRLCWVYRREELMKKGAAATTPRTDSCNPWWWRPNQRLQTELKQMVICTYSSKHPRDSKHTAKLKLTVGKEGSSWRWMRQLKEQTEKMKQMQLKQSATMA